jgi:RNA polymerase sigma-70 factor, ECF subfamily
MITSDPLKKQISTFPFLRKLSQKDYAKKTGISYSGAKSRVQRAKIKLKDLLMKCCHYQFDKYGTVIGIYPAGCCCCTESDHSYQESLQ